MNGPNPGPFTTRIGAFHQAHDGQEGPVARLSRTPAVLRHPGRPLGADTDAVLRELGLAD